MRPKDTNFVGEQVKGIKIKKMIGQGNWADVYLVEQINSHQPLAVKVTPNKKIEEVPKLKELINSEISILRACKNMNVVGLVDQFAHKNHQLIVLEYCNGLQLGEVLIRQGKIDEPTAISYLKQILNGFKGLHQVKAMHRDFKVQNVMLHDGVCKIVDLGFGKQLIGEGEMTRTKLGSNFTMAPEVMQGLPYGFKADIWSIGVVFYQLLFGKFPFQGRSVTMLLEKARNQDYSLQQISQESKDFITKCLKFDASERIDWVDIYKHPLIVNQDLQVNISFGQSKINIEQNAKFYQTSNIILKEAYPSLYQPKHLQKEKQKKEQREEQKEKQKQVQKSSLLSLMKPQQQKSRIRKSQINKSRGLPQQREEERKEVKGDKSRSRQEGRKMQFSKEMEETKSEIFVISRKRIRDINFQYDIRIKDICFMYNYLIRQMIDCKKQPQSHHFIMACLLLKESYLKISAFINQLNVKKITLDITAAEFQAFLDEYGEILMNRLLKIRLQIEVRFKRLRGLIDLKIQKKVKVMLENIDQGKKIYIGEQLDTYIAKIEKSYFTRDHLEQKRILKLSFALTKFKAFHLEGTFSGKVLLVTLGKFDFAKAENYLKNKYGCKQLPRKESFKKENQSMKSAFKDVFRNIRFGL